MGVMAALDKLGLEFKKKKKKGKRFTLLNNCIQSAHVFLFAIVHTGAGFLPL